MISTTIKIEDIICDTGTQCLKLDERETESIFVQYFPIYLFIDLKLGKSSKIHCIRSCAWPVRYKTFSCSLHHAHKLLAT